MIPRDACEGGDKDSRPEKQLCPQSSGRRALPSPLSTPHTQSPRVPSPDWVPGQDPGTPGDIPAPPGAPSAWACTRFGHRGWAGGGFPCLKGRGGVEAQMGLQTPRRGPGRLHLSGGLAPGQPLPKLKGRGGLSAARGRHREQEAQGHRRGEGGFSGGSPPWRTGPRAASAQTFEAA